MKAETKAKFLIQIHKDIISRIFHDSDIISIHLSAKLIAINTVKEVIKNIEKTRLYKPDIEYLKYNNDYWQKVKLEIEKL